MYPDTIFFTVSTSNEHGYEKVRVTVKAGRATAITDAVEECRTGKRYCEDEVNARVMPQLQELADQGFKTLCDHYSGDMYLSIEWQVYEREGNVTRYCRPTYESLGQEFGQIEVAMKFLRKVGGRIETARRRETQKRYTHKVSKQPVRNCTFESADEFIDALRALKAVQIRTVEFGRYQTYEVAA